MTWFSSLFLLLSNFHVNSIMLFDDDDGDDEDDDDDGDDDDDVVCVFSFAREFVCSRASHELIVFNFIRFFLSLFTSICSVSACASAHAQSNRSQYLLHLWLTIAFKFCHLSCFLSFIVRQFSKIHGKRESNKTFNLMTFYLVDLPDEPVPL